MTWRNVAGQVHGSWPKLAAPVDESEHDLRAYLAFSARHHTTLYSTTPIELLYKKAKRLADVVGIFPNEASITRLIGAVLFEEKDEWATQHCCMQVEAFSKFDAAEPDPILSIATGAA